MGSPLASTFSPGSKPTSADAPDSVVKSAGRTLAILETFQAWKRPATARDLAGALNLPRSSANALLASLVTLGYLQFNPETSTYFPTMRVGLLGEWLLDSVRRDRILTGIMRELSAATGETISASVRAGMSMQFVSIVPSTFPVALNIAEGALADLFDSAVGRAWLAAQSPETVDDLRRAYNRHSEGEAISAEACARRLENVEQQGAAIAYGAVSPDTGAIAIAYPKPVRGQTVVIGLGGPISRIKRAEAQVVTLMRRLIRQALG